MFGWGKPKKSPMGIPYPLVFKSADAAIEYSSAWMICKLRAGVHLPAVVLDSRDVAGTREAVHRRDDGIQLAWIRVAGDDGGFITMSETSGPCGPHLVPGDMVLWCAFAYKPELAGAFQDKRGAWVGLIVGTLAPELNSEGWKGLKRFHE